jgi:hypothetical protein
MSNDDAISGLICVVGVRFVYSIRAARLANSLEFVESEPVRRVLSLLALPIPAGNRFALPF